jgi:hypothetical protein
VTAGFLYPLIGCQPSSPLARAARDRRPFSQSRDPMELTSITLDSATIAAIVGGVALICLAVWYFFGDRDAD